MILPLEIKCMEVAIFHSFEVAVQIASVLSLLKCEKRTHPSMLEGEKNSSPEFLALESENRMQPKEGPPLLGARVRWNQSQWNHPKQELVGPR